MAFLLLNFLVNPEKDVLQFPEFSSGRDVAFSGISDLAIVGSCNIGFPEMRFGIRKQQRV